MKLQYREVLTKRVNTKTDIVLQLFGIILEKCFPSSGKKRFGINILRKHAVILSK